MNKDEIVKDIAKTICEFETPCNKCEFNTKKYRCSSKAYAEQVYNAGYRKVGKDEIVLKKSEYENLRLAQYNAQTTINENFLLALEKIEQAKQDTAREILQTILDEIGIDMLGNCYRLPTRVFNKIKDKYGVELEDEDND